MFTKEIIKGRIIDLRPVDFTDAEFIVRLRNDTTKNQYVHSVSKNVELQKEWIKKQHDKEGDYYFIVVDKSGNNIGLASIYNVDENNKSAEFGRWISWGNAAQNIESAILSFDFAFKNFNVDTVYMKTMYDNKKVRSFWKRFGAVSVGKMYENEMWLDKSVVERDGYFSELRDQNMVFVNYFSGL